MKKTIALDHGNRNMKGLHTVFTSSFTQCDNLPNIGGDLLRYDGKSYTLTNQRFPQLNDKTNDDRFFILSLFALGKEICKMEPIPPDEIIQIELLTGLPPLHYKKLYKKFENYFKNREPRILFEFNKRPFCIQIMDAYAYPQAYAASLTVYEQIKDHFMVNIVDLGGYTVDCLLLEQCQPNMAICTSLHCGVNTLFDHINEQIRSQFFQNIPDIIIEKILLNDTKVLLEYPKKRIQIVQECADIYVRQMLDEVAGTGLDLEANKTIFMGGGAILLKDHLVRSAKVKNMLFVEDIHANVKGYYIIHNMHKALKNNL